jgi:serine/threonine protein kinase
VPPSRAPCAALRRPRPGAAQAARFREAAALISDLRAALLESVAAGVALLHDGVHVPGFASQRSIIHGDIKSENVLLSSDGAPRLSDFGIADTRRATSGATTAGASAGGAGGTMCYMAPELFRGPDARLSSATDVYALGTLAWALRRDLKIALRRSSDALNVLGFFALACSMFPLAVGPQREWLTRIGPGVIWVAALLATRNGAVWARYTPRTTRFRLPRTKRNSSSLSSPRPPPPPASASSSRW